MTASFPDPADASYLGAEDVPPFVPGPRVFCKFHYEERHKSLVAATGVEIKKHVLKPCQGRALFGTSCTSDKDIVTASFSDTADASYLGAEGVPAFRPSTRVFCLSHAKARCESLKAATGIEVLLRSSRRRCAAFNHDGTQCVHHAAYRDPDPKTDATKLDFCASHASAKRAGLDAKHGAGYARPNPATTAPTCQFVTPHGVRCEKNAYLPDISIAGHVVGAHVLCHEHGSSGIHGINEYYLAAPSRLEQRAVTSASASRSCSRSARRATRPSRRRQRVDAAQCTTGEAGKARNIELAGAREFNDA